MRQDVRHGQAAIAGGHVEETREYIGPVLVTALESSFTVVQRSAFARAALSLEDASYLTVAIHGSAQVPSVAEPARVDISLPRQALGLPWPGLSFVTFKLWDKSVAAALEAVLISGQTSGGRVDRWYVWNHDAELVACRGWDSEVAVASSARSLSGWVEGLWRKGVVRGGVPTTPGTRLLAIGLALGAIVTLAVWGILQFA